jgi:hypothetical protein
MKVIENQPAPWTGFLLPPIEVIVMRLCVATLLAAVVSSGLPGKANADDGAKAILDKAIKALGGEEKLKSVQAFTWTANASIKANRKVSDSVFLVTFQGLDHVRRDFRTRAPYRVLMSGDKGWHTAGGQYRPMTKEALERQKRMTYLQVASTLLVPLKSPGFKYEAAGEEEVRGKPALILKVTGPDGKDFTISFDKESFLPVKEVAHRNQDRRRYIWLHRYHRVQSSGSGLRQDVRSARMNGVRRVAS